MAIKSRSQIIQSTDVAQLKAQFKDSSCQPADLDAFPSITINQPSGNISVGPTSIGVVRLDTGLYSFDYDVGCNPSLGVYSDIWEGLLNGIPVKGEFNFIVHNTQMPFVNSDGYKSVGDDPGMCFSQLAICNINRLLKSLRGRLDSRGKSKFCDEFGNPVYVDCDIFSPDQLVTFLELGLSMFNEIPHFTNFTFEDTQIIDQFREVLVQGATIYALSSKALLERGREFSLTDNGINFVPPGVSDIMSTQYSAEMTQNFEKIKLIKSQMKPFPIALGTLTFSTSRNPAIARLRHLRSRQLF